MQGSPFGGAREAACAHSALASMTGRDFERLIDAEFRRRGFTVTGFGGANGVRGPGVDIALMKNGERFLVECKQWRKQQVGVTVVRRLSSVIRAVSAAGGYLFTSGDFPHEARVLARISRIELIDGRSLLGWLGAATSGAAVERR